MYTLLSAISWSLAVLAFTVHALRYDPREVKYNLNQNESAMHARDYWGEWYDHSYHPSPSNWRFPFYVVTQDRFADGDPTNNEANGTVFEHHWMSNQFRFGGDVRGLQDNLDYIYGMGIRGIYMTGSPFYNLPWAGDGYGPLDFTLLDHHHGEIEDWRNLIAAAHEMGMYIILDNTVSTMTDLISFQGWVNATTLTPFNFDEYDYVWKTDMRYNDFSPGNAINSSCQYPRMWGQDGYPIPPGIKNQFKSCRISEFDAYGDINGIGAYPTWQNQLSKFASVQDRLREWRPDVLEKIMRMSCLTIAMLDIDGYRIDKTVQITIDAMAEFSDHMRQCAKRYGKDNFYIVGEVVSDPRQAAVYLGRGKQPNQNFENLTQALVATGETTSPSYIRPWTMSALDGTAFNYDIYGAMTRFLGVDGPWGKRGVDWVKQWEMLLESNDMVNAITGKFDPRQMFGMTGQDVFRWPALAHGIQRQLLGLMIVTIELPGVPLLFYGEEQESYILDNQASDYVFGRQPMSSSRAWQLHGCYGLGETVYVDINFNSSKYGCSDDRVSLDHKDPSHPVRNVMKRMYELRMQYPVLSEGFNLTALSSRVHNVWLRDNNGTSSPTGLWSVYRGRAEGIQDLRNHGGQGNQGVWLIYHNENSTIQYNFNCASQNTSDALISPFSANTTVKNLFYPYEEHIINQQSSHLYGIEGMTEFNGCFSNFTLDPFGWKAFVPIQTWVKPRPTITRVIPGHDQRILTESDGPQTVQIEIRFSREMDCQSVTENIQINSTTVHGIQPVLNLSSVTCTLDDNDTPRYGGEIASAWKFSFQLDNVHSGIHQYAVRNASTPKDEKNLFDRMEANDRFMFRLGRMDNPIVFPERANYTKGLLSQNQDGTLTVSHVAPGADKYRYSTNFGSSWSPWLDYTGSDTTIKTLPWTGTKVQEWDGYHVILNYWSRAASSAHSIQHTDLNWTNQPIRRWPHVFAEGEFNQFGYDRGLPNAMSLTDNGIWKFDFVSEWPANLVINVWGMNPDGLPDKSAAYGDVDRDGVLDWLEPNSLASNVINISTAPAYPAIGFRVVVNDGNYHYHLEPIGSAYLQICIATILGLIPLACGVLGVWIFTRFFYKVKFNEVGITKKSHVLQIDYWGPKISSALFRTSAENLSSGQQTPSQPHTQAISDQSILAPSNPPRKFSVLIGTLEYNIDDWNISVKIGGLGVISNLMGKHLPHRNLIWVVPCVGDIEFPLDTPAPPMEVTILGEKYLVSVQYHVVRYVTFVLLDAPIFRKQTKKEPYPARMDDLQSAIYYSAWNQCIAHALKRFDVDLYHMNDYHGTVAPLHLLPRTIPCSLSLHNADFQGLWPMRTWEDKEEICQVYNLPVDIVEKYVQFGEVFNLLHAGASYLRIHQNGFGAVGVSPKYGKRSWARYPIFWGLPKVGHLQNPDPSDTGSYADGVGPLQDVTIEIAMENTRGDLRVQAQQWAGLKVDPEAELFVFIGRWSQQKGVDIIADVFPSILQNHKSTQLICVGPVIDLYGKFAALKLEKLMTEFPGRVFSKPEFTQLPPYLFRGAEFALIPSRDEPFGLVAVEFGRKGAIGIGARVGGLGQMPGWWYTVESMAPKHLQQQFKAAIESGLASTKEARAMMRARSGLQRFPVARWVDELDALHATSIKNFNQAAKRVSKPGSAWLVRVKSRQRLNRPLGAASSI